MAPLSIGIIGVIALCISWAMYMATRRAEQSGDFFSRSPLIFGAIVIGILGVILVIVGALLT